MLLGRKAYSLDNLREVSQVECIVRLCGSWLHVFLDLLVNTQGRLNKPGVEHANFSAEITDSEEPLEN